jgi:hypothetical protein
MDPISLWLAKEMANKKWPDNEPPSWPWKLDGGRERVQFANDHDLEAMARPGAHEIVVNEEDYNTASLEAWDVIEEMNGYTDPAEFIFTYGDVPHRMKCNQEGRWVPELLTKDRLMSRLTDLIIWKARRQKDSKVVRQPTCPSGVASLVLARPSPPIPALRRIVEAPVLDRHGSVVDEPGYHADAQLFYMPADDLKVPYVNPRPLKRDRDRALKLVLNELFVDFPFRTEADRTQAVLLFLEPFVRDMIPGLTPLWVVEAPTPGTGKSLLVDCALHAATGLASVPIMTPEGMDGQEWRKQITTHMLSGVPALKLDNVTDLSSTVLSGALTTPEWHDRILGVNREINIPIRLTWTATGNNISMSKEMVRRTVMIYLDPDSEFPEERTAFRNVLPRYIYENRAEFIWAALTLARWWAKDDPRHRPRKGTPQFGSFVEWRRVMGGIATALGLPGFLGNQLEKRERADSGTSAVAEVLERWYVSKGGKEIVLNELPLTVTEPLGWDRADPAYNKRLGNLARELVDGIYGGYRLRYARDPATNEIKQKHKTKMYFVEKVNSGADDADAAPDD